MPWEQPPIPGFALRQRDTAPRQLALPGMGKSQFEGPQPWHLNEHQFNDAHRVIRSFDDLEHGKPAVLQAYHGASQSAYDNIRREGFKPGRGANASAGIETSARYPRRHLLSDAPNDGVYVAEYAHAKDYDGSGSGPQPVVAHIKNPRVDEEMEPLEVLDTRPQHDVFDKGHDSWFIQRGSTGSSWYPKSAEDWEDHDADAWGGDYSWGGEPDTGEPLRQGVVINPKNVRMLPEGHEHEPLRTPVVGARVRHTQTGEQRVITQSPGGGSGEMRTASVHTGFPKESNTYTGQPLGEFGPHSEPDGSVDRDDNYKNYEVVGGWHDQKMSALQAGKRVPGSSWERDSRVVSRSYPSRAAVGERLTLFDHMSLGRRNSTQGG